MTDLQRDTRQSGFTVLQCDHQEQGKLDASVQMQGMGLLGLLVVSMGTGRGLPKGPSSLYKLSHLQGTTGASAEKTETNRDGRA